MRSSSSRTTRSSILVGYADLARECGLDPAAMLRRMNLDTRCLVDSDMRIPVEPAARLLDLSAIEASAEDFGLRLAEVRGVPDLGPLSLLLREEPNLRCALASLHRYMSVHSSGLSIRLRANERAPVVCADLMGVQAGPARQAREMIVAGVFNFLAWLKGPRWRPLRVCFAHPAPRSIRTHRRIFGCPIEFDQDFNGVVVRNSDLSAPLLHADPMLRAHAERYVNLLMGEGGATFEDAVRKLIAQLLPMDRCCAEAVAERLGIDRRTLTRRLAKRGLTYGSILQSVRVSVAMQRVGARGGPLTAVADALGFSSLSAFSHWFQDTFHRSAREWRARESDALQRPAVRAKA